MSVERHLVMVHQQTRQALRDFEAIAAIVRHNAPDIEVFIVDNENRSSITRKHAARLPSVVFSPGPLDRFQPVRGRIFAGHPYSKIEQLERLSACGVAVPPFVRGCDARRETLAGLGPLVLSKPARPGASLGTGFALLRSDAAPAGAAGDNLRDQVFYQRFIITGDYPEQFRVLALFGRPLFAFRKVSLARGPSADGSDADLSAACIQPRRKTGQKLDLAVPPDVLAMASDCYRAFSDIPLQGVDIVREAGSGRLFVLEINPGGNTWVFSMHSTGGVYQSYLAQELGVADLADPYDAFRTAAAALIDVTRRAAE